MSKWASNATVVDGVAEVVDAGDATTGDMERRDDGPCHWGGTFRNPCFWVLVGVAATLGFQYVLRRTSK